MKLLYISGEECEILSARDIEDDDYDDGGVFEDNECKLKSIKHEWYNLFEFESEERYLRGNYGNSQATSSLRIHMWVTRRVSSILWIQKIDEYSCFHNIRDEWYQN